MKKPIWNFWRNDISNHNNLYNAMDTKLNSYNRKYNSILTKQKLKWNVWTITILYIISYCNFLCNITEAFNLDSKHPVIIPGSNKNSYFGFAVDMYTDNDDTWIVVGAPKSRGGQGDVYKCKYSNSELEECQKININREPTATSSVKEMFGWTVKATKNKQVLACAPLFTQESVVHSVTYYDLLGICYLTQNFMSANPNVYKLIPCQSGKGRNHDGDEHGQCLAGFSATFTKNGDRILLGAPGSYYKQGTIMVNDLPITNDVLSLPVHLAEFIPEIPKGWKRDDYLRQSYDDNYLGYTVETGQSAGNSPILVASAPRRFGYDLLGMVTVYDEQMNGVLYNFTGKQAGEYFGQGLAVIDVNNDNLDDIIIGAPLYTNYDKKMSENGRLYVYHQIPQAGLVTDKEKTALMFDSPLIIEGEKNLGRFGHIVTNLGDINRDGYNDIGVGAPYAGEGSLYIFNGGPNGLRAKYSQEIQGLNLDNKTKIKSFGYSLAGEKDADHNGYPDVITGAYLSDRVVLLRSRPVVDITASITVSPSRLDLEVRACKSPYGGANKVGCIEINSCFIYTGKSLPPSIGIEYTYDIDSSKTGNDKRAFLIDESPKSLTLTRNSPNDEVSKEECVQETAYLQGDIKDKLNQLNIQLLYSLIENDDPIQPVLNQLEQNYTMASINIEKDCGADDVCQPELLLQTELNPKIAYVGQSTAFTVTAHVSNQGDPSYLTNLVLQYPHNVYYVGVEGNQAGIVPTCLDIDNTIMCGIGNPLKRNAKSTVVLKFSVTGLLVFSRSFVNSTNPVQSTSNTMEFDMQIEVLSEIVIYNISDPQLIFMNEEKTSGRPEQNETSVTHIFQILNKGPSDIKSAKVTINWPVRTKSGLYLLELDELFTSDTVNCNEIPASSKTRTRRELDDTAEEEVRLLNKLYHCDQEADCFEMECDILNFNSQQEETIKVISTLDLSTVRDGSDAEITSDLKFDILQYPYEINQGPGPTTVAHTTTITTYDREPVTQDVAWWIIAVAIAVGLLVLILLVVCLWKCGFFKRKRKPQQPSADQLETQRLTKEPVNEDEQELDSYLK